MEGRDRSKFQGYEHTPLGKREIRFRNGALGIVFIGGVMTIWSINYSKFGKKLRQNYRDTREVRDDAAEKLKPSRIDIETEFSKDRENLLPVSLDFFSFTRDYFKGEITLHEFLTLRRFKDEESRQKYLENHPREIVLKKKSDSI